MMKAMIVLLLIIGFIVSPASPASAADHLIVPGVRIGRWTLQMSIYDLVRMNGSASRRVSITGGQPPYSDLRGDFTKYEWSSVRLFAFTSDDRRLNLIKILSDSPVAYKTKEGIGPQSTSQEVRRAYGVPSATTKNSSETTLIYDNIGFSVTLDDTGVSDFGVFRPREARKIWNF